jgi:Undecaprenyl-phosphate glucose phosphotransferase
MDQSGAGRPVNTGPANDTSDQYRAATSDAAALTRAQLRAQARTPQHRLNRRALGRTLQFIDVFVVLALSAAGLVGAANGNVLDMPAGLVLPFAAFALTAPWLFETLGQYRIEPRGGLAYRALRALIALGASGAICVALAHLTAPQNTGVVADFAIIAVIAMTTLHAAYAGFIRHWAKAGRLSRNVLLIGATANARKLITANAGSGVVNVVGVFDDRKSRSPSQLAGAPYLGDTDDLFNWPLLHEVDRIVVTVSPKAEGRVQLLLGKLRALPQPICLLLDLEGFDPATTSLEKIVGMQSATVSGSQERLGHLIAKRLQDLVFGSILFALALPVMMLIGLLVKLDSPGPVLFRQTREGFNGRPITVFKFRSMRHDPGAAGKAVRQVERDDPRVTRLGDLLRRTSLDELPQFWNVLTGDMSLVGPRPHAPSMKTGGLETSKLVAEYAHRHRVKPGITGWAQVNGSRGPLHTPEAARERISWDLDYITRSNFFFDIWIMLRTVPALLGDKINIR